MIYAMATGSTVKQAFQVIRSFGFYSAIPGVFLLFFVELIEKTKRSTMGIQLGIMLIAVIGTYWCIAILIDLTSKISVHISYSILHGLSLFRQVFSIIISTFIFCLCSFPIGLLAILGFRFLMPSIPREFVFPVTAALILLSWLAYGFLWIRVVLAPQAIVIEKLGPIKGLNRSWVLTKGSFKELFVLHCLLLLLLVTILVIAYWSHRLFNPAESFRIVLESNSGALHFLLNFFCYVVLIPFWQICLTLLFNKLPLAKVVE
jgi:hypothetical protein